MNIFQRLQITTKGIFRRRLTLDEAFIEASGHNDVLCLDRKTLQTRISNALDSEDSSPPENFVRAQQAIADEIQNVAQENGLPQERINEITENFLAQKLYAFTVVSSVTEGNPEALRVGDEQSGLLIDDFRQPPSLTFFYKNTATLLSGYSGLDAALGKDFTNKAYAFTQLHERAHIGDHALFLLAQKIANKELSGPAFAEYRQSEKFAGEIRADVMAANLHYRVYKDTEFLRTWTYLRALNMLAGGVEHATAFELGACLNALDPQAPKLPYVPPKEIGRAYAGLERTLGLVPLSSEQTATTTDRNSDFQFAAKIALFKKGLKNGTITDTHQKSLAEFSVLAYDHIETIMANNAPSVERQNVANASLSGSRKKGPSLQAG